MWYTKAPFEMMSCIISFAYVNANVTKWECNCNKKKQSVNLQQQFNVVVVTENKVFANIHLWPLGDFSHHDNNVLPEFILFCIRMFLFVCYIFNKQAATLFTLKKRPILSVTKNAASYKIKTAKSSITELSFLGWRCRETRSVSIGHRCLRQLR